MREQTDMPDDRSAEHCINVNAGGTRYTTTLSTLLSQENSYFTCILSEDWNDKSHAELFIDRDGEMFKHVLRFLRASPQGKVNLVRSLSTADRIALAEEASFFQLDNLSHLLDNCKQQGTNVLGQNAGLQLHEARWSSSMTFELSTAMAQENANTADLPLRGYDILHSSNRKGVVTFLLAVPQQLG